MYMSKCSSQQVSLSLSLEADCARDRTQGLFHRLPVITSCCTDGVQLTLQNLGGHLEMLCRRLATCILQQCRRRCGLRTAAVTRWRTTPTGGYDRPTQRSPYSTPRPIVAVQRGDMHVPRGHREQRWQRTQRDARNRGAAAVVVVSRCSRSLAASVACRSPPRQ